MSIRDVMEWFAARVLGALDVPYLPKAVEQLPRPLMLHVSDTPSHVYPYLIRLIRKLEPEVVVHTGDVADELKLGENRSHIEEYRRKVSRFVSEVEKTAVKDIYYVIGNHDDYDTVAGASIRSSVVEGSALFEIHGLRCYLTHYCTDPHTVGEKTEPDLILFGHNPDVATRRPFLNGLFHIHVISLGSKEVIFLPYPAGTDSARKMLPPKIGL